MDSNSKIKATEIVDDIQSRIKSCWIMVEVFTKNQDAHGVHDMGVEIQALERSLEEVNKVFS